MKKAFTFQLVNYSPLLREYRILFRELEKTLCIGTVRPGKGWAIVISARTTEMPALLQSVLPVLKEAGTPFILIKNQLLQYRLNAGAYGESEVGKALCIYPKTDEDAVSLVDKLTLLTNEFAGPLVSDTARVGNVIYLLPFIALNGQIRHEPAYKSTLPVPLPPQFRQQRRRWLIGKYYLPVQVIRGSAKGDIYKAINLKNLAFDWCLIKQGRPVALDDHFKRDMKDRLLWQKNVLESVSRDVYTPEVIDFFEQDGSTYLVMAFAEGRSLGKVIKDRLEHRTWKELEHAAQQQCLIWYEAALNLTANIHAKGYIHRDLTDSNFIVMPDRTLCIIDFELSYNFQEGRPDTPFVLGTQGYVAPEQLLMAVPGTGEDIYSLGALLCFVLTGTHPRDFIKENAAVNHATLFRLTGDAQLTNLACRCLKESPGQRPDLDEIKTEIRRKIQI